MRKAFGADQVRVTVRLPRDLYEELCRARPALGVGNSGFLSRVLRAALRHFLDCKTLQPARNKRRAAQQRRAPLQPLPGERRTF